MTRDHLLGFPAVLRQHDEPVVPKEQTVKERPAAFVAFETGNHLPAGMLVGVDPAVEEGDKTSIVAWGIDGPIWDRKTREGPKNIVLDPKPPKPAKKDAEQAAFENWCDKTRPSGDVESVQRQWMESDERAELFETETREITYDGVFGAIRKLVAELGKPAAVALLAEFGAQKGVDLKPEQWAEFIATAERRLAGWIKWSGGEQPVADDAMVEVRYGEGTRDCGPAKNWSWKHYGDAAGDIVEYQVVVKKAKQGSIPAKFW